MFNSCFHRMRYAPMFVVATSILVVASQGCNSSPKAKSAAAATNEFEVNDSRGLDSLDLTKEDTAIIRAFLRQARLSDDVSSAAGGGMSLSTLVSNQLRDPQVSDLVNWFNLIPDLEENPFASTARSELQAAVESGLPLDECNINPTVGKALARAGVISRTDLASLDIDAFAESKALITEVRTLINEALLAAGYSGLWVTVDNPWAYLELHANGMKIGLLEPTPATTYRRFCVMLPGTADNNRIVDLSIDPPTGENGSKEVRFHQSVELVRGETTRCLISPYPTPALSIGMSAANNTGTPVVLAGDEVKLSVESPIEADLTDIVWVELAAASTKETEAADVLAANGGSTPALGLIAWTRLRDLVVDEKTGVRPGAPSGVYGHTGSRHHVDMLSGGVWNERIIGTGTEVQWIPQIESPDTQVVVLARNSAGLWGIAKRAVPVIDLRPGIWARPQANIVFGAPLADSASTLDWSRVNQIAVVQGILHNMSFIGTEGQPLKIELCSTPFSEAHVPLREIRVDYGDGTPNDELNEPRELVHTWSDPGTYVLTVTATGIDGLERTVSSTIEIEALPEEEPALAETGSATTPVFVPAVSSAELFTQTAWEWSRTVANRITSELEAVNALEISHIHSNLQRPVVDMFDEALVEAFISRGAQVYERDAIWQVAVDRHGALDPQDVFADEKATSASDAAARHVVAYKLYQAGVTTTAVGAGLAVRSAEVRAYVRVHDPVTTRITFAEEVTARTSDLVLYGEVTLPAWEGWNDQPSDWMIYLGRPLD